MNNLSKHLLIYLSTLAFCYPTYAKTIRKSNLPKAKTFRKYVLKILKTYPTNGKHQYYWPRKAKGYHGTTRNLYYQNTLIAKGDKKGRCYCCGLTFEVFFRAYQLYCAKRKIPFRILNFTPQQVKKLRIKWYGADGNPKCSYNAILSMGLGKAVNPKKAKPGDFVQFWRKSGSGHSVIFIKWKRNSSGQIIGLTYWSTQKSTKGIGFKTEYFRGKYGILPKKIYIARVGK